MSENKRQLVFWPRTAGGGRQMSHYWEQTHLSFDDSPAIKTPVDEGSDPESESQFFDTEGNGRVNYTTKLHI